MSTATLKKFIPFAKVDETKREVWGIVTAEVADKDGETCDYEGTKPHYKAWSAEFQKATDGASYGNLREMHQLKAAGRGIGIMFDDEAKEIHMGFKVVDEEAWKKVAEKVYTGFSQGGDYVEGPDVNGRYTAKPSEVSLVDNPCLGVARYTLVRADGAVELVKIRSAAVEKKGEKKTKRVAGEDLPASAFAYVGDPEETSTWKLPIKFSTDEKSKSHIRNALARFDQVQGIPEEEKAKVRAKIVAAAKEHGIEVTDKAALAALMTKAAGDLAKGMYEVGTFARLIMDLDWLRAASAYEREYEGDESEIPDDLLDQLQDLCQTFLLMAEEETNELTAAAARSRKETEKTMQTDLQKAAAELSKAGRSSLHAHMKKAMEHNDKMKGCLEECMKAMGHEAEDREPDSDDVEKAAKARKAFEAAGLNGPALEKAVRKFTGQPDAGISLEDVGNVVEEKLGAMLKTIFGRDEAAPAPKQTVIPVQKTGDGQQQQQQPVVAKEGVHDPEAALAFAKADSGVTLDPAKAMAMGILK